jgi:methionyl-tRNA synthetase
METIKFNDFEKIELKVATILSAEKVEGADKLLELQIDLGNEKRQLVAGIAEKYKPEKLKGMQIVVVANLEPKTIKGVESKGMLLAAVVGSEPVLLKPDKAVPAGTKVS